MQTFQTFHTAQDARDYRHENGTGGWIFVPDNLQTAMIDAPTMPVVLFPPDISPSRIFRHPFTKGQSGALLSN